MVWHEVKKELPPQGKDVLLLLNDGTVHEGRFLKNANKYVKDVNKFMVYREDKYVDMGDIIFWRDMPLMGAHYE